MSLFRRFFGSLADDLIVPGRARLTDALVAERFTSANLNSVTKCPVRISLTVSAYIDYIKKGSKWARRLL